MHTLKKKNWEEIEKETERQWEREREMEKEKVKVRKNGRKREFNSCPNVIWVVVWSDAYYSLDVSSIPFA